MLSKKNKIIYLLSLFLLLCFLMISNQTTDLSNNRNFDIFSKQDKQNLIQLKTSEGWILSAFIIDNDGGGTYTWAEAALEPWCSGNGTIINPYVIENVTFDAMGNGDGLLIRDSNVYFILRNNTFYNSGSISIYAGIRLNKADNGKLINNNCSYNNMGISIQWSDNCNVTRNIVEHNQRYGIEFLYANYGEISDNIIIENNGTGINFSGTNNYHNVTRNIISNNSGYGIRLISNSRNLVFNNILNILIKK